MPEEQTTVEDELGELARTIEHLDKAAANIRQVVYRLRPLLKSNGPYNASPETEGDAKSPRRFRARRRSS